MEVSKHSIAGDGYLNRQDFSNVHPNFHTPSFGPRRNTHSTFIQFMPFHALENRKYAGGSAGMGVIVLARSSSSYDTI
jgi:hypothetical protein